MAAFFNSWALWEKMTFVLGCLIVLTFLLGFMKVAWRNRFVRLQEIVDEEKRAKIQELRRSGQFVEPRRSLDIPFGVRAIQSGIQVDGIWISGTNTPVPGSPKLGGRYSGSSDSSLRLSVADAAQQMTKQSSSGGISSTMQSDTGASSSDQKKGHLSVPESFSPHTTASHHPSYKPRRSSHLRFGSYGETAFHEDTLAQLEGKADTESRSQSDGRGLSRRDGKKATAYDYIIDNEHSSSSSEASFHDVQEHTGRNPIRVSSLQSSPRVVLSNPHQAPLQAQFSHGQYASVPDEDPEYEKPNNRAQNHNVIEVPTSTEDLRTSQPGTARPSTELPLLSQSYPSPGERESFIPGELHMNRTSRRVNSGFEVLPAGTFGTRSEVRGAQELHEEDDTVDRRQSRKLQKKNRTSFSRGRPSLNADRP